MLDPTDSEELPDATERRKISERAKKSLAEARALLERLDRLETQAARIAEEARLLYPSGPGPQRGRW
jgi:hypothetical protein